jgi:hypothetical protein
MMAWMQVELIIASLGLGISADPRLWENIDGCHAG